MSRDRTDAAFALSSKIRETDPRANDLLRAKCRWEGMTRTAVILEWGDPRTWPDYTEPSTPNQQGEQTC